MSGVSLQGLFYLCHGCVRLLGHCRHTVKLWLSDAVSRSTFYEGAKPENQRGIDLAECLY